VPASFRARSDRAATVDTLCKYGGSGGGERWTACLSTRAVTLFQQRRRDRETTWPRLQIRTVPNSGASSQRSFPQISGKSGGTHTTITSHASHARSAPLLHLAPERSRPTKRSQGQTSEAASDERGDNRCVRHTATAPPSTLPTVPIREGLHYTGGAAPVTIGSSHQWWAAILPRPGCLYLGGQTEDRRLIAEGRNDLHAHRQPLRAPVKRQGCGWVAGGVE
jgi:hypothetical protein